MKSAVRAHLSLTFFVIFASIGILGLYASAAHSLPTTLSKFYLCSVAGYFAGWIYLFNLALLPTRLSRYTSWIAPLLAWAWLLFLISNYFVFRLYKYHISLLLVEMFVTSPEGVGIPIFLQVAFLMVAACLGAFVYYVNRLSYRITDRQYHRLIWVMMLILPTIGFNSITHVWASHYDREEITNLNSLFPAYMPLTGHTLGPSISSALPLVYPAVSGQSLKMATTNSDSILYPLHEIECVSQDSPPSILFVVLESWQKETLRPEIMPNLCDFSECTTEFEQHISGGSTTVPGLFSLLFGLHPSYYDRFKGATQTNRSQFTETLHTLGYQSRVYTSSYLERFSMRSLFFSRIKGDDYFYDMNDQKIVERYLSSLDQQDNLQSPRFDFVFLTSSHSPYTYPAEYAKHQPLPLVEGAFALSSSTDSLPYRNDYYNSLYYIDSLLKPIFDKLKSQGRLDKTWVIVTGDHAEEFNENGLGYWGHGSNFSRWQTHVPLLIHAPGQTKKSVETRLSLHEDIVPTIMSKALGCVSPIEHYSNGTNLYQLPEQRGTVLSSYFTKAYLVDGVIFENNSGSSYSWKDMKEVDKAPQVQEIRQVMAEEQHFLR
jgi:membrane-anchored protein YejM (alkaline phosphatase superfamily)